MSGISKSSNLEKEGSSVRDMWVVGEVAGAAHCGSSIRTLMAMEMTFDFILRTMETHWKISFKFSSNMISLLIF